MRTVKQACIPRPGTFDPNRRDTVLDLTDLIEDRIDPGEFFAENYITEGMKTLLTEGFRRLEGKSEQGVFKLTQAMGGGKTHNLLALGLLAKHPEHRSGVMGEFYSPSAELGPTRVVAFTGRESDAPWGIWGAIAEQLGKKEQFADLESETGRNAMPLEPVRMNTDEFYHILRYLARTEIDHWHQDTATALVVARAVENEHV